MGYTSRARTPSPFFLFPSLLPEEQSSPPRALHSYWQLVLFPFMECVAPGSSTSVGASWNSGRLAGILAASCAMFAQSCKVLSAFGPGRTLKNRQNHGGRGTSHRYSTLSALRVALAA